MTKYVLENVKVGVSEGGVACGSVGGSVNVEACVRAIDDGKVTYHTITDYDGFPSFMITDESKYDGLMEENYEDTEFWTEVQNSEVAEYGDYNDFYEDLQEHELCKEEWEPIWRYLAYMACADWNEIDKMKILSVGKVLGDFEIPVCDMEQEYLNSKKAEN